MAGQNAYVDLNLNGQMLTAGSLRSRSVSGVGTRQTVLTGALDASGRGNALAIGTGLTVTLSANPATPFVASFAGGFDANYGCLDWVASATANLTFSGLTANTTCYLYLDLNLVTGALTPGFTTLAPIYANTGPGGVATGQHLFFLPSMQMLLWGGAAYTQVYRVFVGECVTGASAVTSIITYAYQGRYQSDWTAVTANTVYRFNHNLGIAPSIAGGGYNVYSSQFGADASAVLAIVHPVTASVGFYYFPTFSTAPPTRQAGVTTNATPLLGDANTAWLTSGFYKLNAWRGF